MCSSEYMLVIKIRWPIYLLAALIQGYTFWAENSFSLKSDFSCSSWSLKPSIINTAQRYLLVFEYVISEETFCNVYNCKCSRGHPLFSNYFMPISVHLSWTCNVLSLVTHSVKSSKSTLLQLTEFKTVAITFFFLYSGYLKIPVS